MVLAGAFPLISGDLAYFLFQVASKAADNH
jgi:hypothetical protein